MTDIRDNETVEYLFDRIDKLDLNAAKRIDYSRRKELLRCLKQNGIFDDINNMVGLDIYKATSIERTIDIDYELSIKMTEIKTTVSFSDGKQYGYRDLAPYSCYHKLREMKALDEERLNRINMFNHYRTWRLEDNYDMVLRGDKGNKILYPTLSSTDYKSYSPASAIQKGAVEQKECEIDAYATWIKRMEEIESIKKPKKPSVFIPFKKDWIRKKYIIWRMNKTTNDDLFLYLANELENMLSLGKEKNKIEIENQKENKTIIKQETKDTVAKCIEDSKKVIDEWEEVKKEALEVLG